MLNSALTEFSYQVWVWSFARLQHLQAFKSPCLRISTRSDLRDAAITGLCHQSKSRCLLLSFGSFHSSLLLKGDAANFLSDEYVHSNLWDKEKEPREDKSQTRYRNKIIICLWRKVIDNVAGRIVRRSFLWILNSITKNQSHELIEFPSLGFKSGCGRCKAWKIYFESEYNWLFLLLLLLPVPLKIALY